MEDFFQEGAELNNTFAQDKLLKAFLHWKLPQDKSQSLLDDLHQLGDKAVGPYLSFAREAQRDLPVHTPFGPWGHRQDQLKLSRAWLKLHEASAAEGLVAIAYDRHQGEFSRLYQFAKLYLFHPSSAFYTCPLAMTDGAARVMELHASAEVKQKFFPHLVSRVPAEFWTSGQWMTEKTGGSDVSLSQTVADPASDGSYRLTGIKWFCSATTSQMALGLARIKGDPEGSRGLSLFAMKVFDDQGLFDQVKVLRLKDKLGTKALPTAELELCGITGWMVGERGQGVKTVTTMLNITRMYNSVCAIAQCTRLFQLARDYSGKRQAFGRKLPGHALHTETLADHYLWLSLGTCLTFELSHLLGKEECGQASDSENSLVRLLTPIAKLYTGKLAVHFCSELLESFGGAGYMEDSGVPLIFRDAQVFPIWEGTTNVLSLDVLRVLKNGEVLEHYFVEVQERLKGVSSFKAERAFVEKDLIQLQQHVAWMKSASVEELQGGARAFAWSLGQVFAASVLLAMAENQNEPASRTWCELLVKRLVNRPLVKLTSLTERQIGQGADLIFG